MELNVACTRVTAGQNDGAIVAIFTIILATFTVGLYRETAGLRVAADQQKRDTVESLRIAQESANSAARIVTVSENTAITTQRAFVSIANVFIKPIVNSGFEKPFTWRVEPIWENSGQTATKGGANYISFRMFTDIPDETHIFQDFLATREGQPLIVLGPNSTVVGESHQILPVFMKRAKRGEGYIFVWGWFEYNDVFDGTPRPRTEFCRLLEIDGSPDDVSCSIRTRVFGRHNGADDECQHKPKTEYPPRP